MKKEEAKVKSNQDKKQKPEKKTKSERHDYKKEVQELKKEMEALKEQITNLENEKKELNDTLLRRVADFENYKRRKENEQQSLVEFAAEPFVKSILPVFDDLERSLQHVEKNKDSVIEGIKMVYDKFKKTLSEQGVQKIEAKGKEFDFNLHEALMQQEVPNVPPHTVLEEVEPGYIYKDKVIKHAKVIVSMATTENTSEPKKEEPKNEGNEE